MHQKVLLKKNSKYYIILISIRWFTNLNHKGKYDFKIKLTKKYYGNEDYYPKYDNFDAINVNKTKNIPMDYKGLIGIPITFIDKYNPNQFKIIYDRPNYKILSLNKKRLFARFIIKNKCL